MGLSRYQILLAVGMLVTGSINTLSKKAQNDCHVKGVAIPSGPNGTAEATAHEFDHPWFQTIIMFIGESLCLLGLLIARRQEREAFRGQLRETHFQNEPPEDVKLKQPRQSLKTHSYKLVHLRVWYDSNNSKYSGEERQAMTTSSLPV
eukprot:XP_011669353.1 PREDICTED: uncharacterized protein LOC105440638 [Strongylocentrotus purpuratus]